VSPTARPRRKPGAAAESCGRGGTPQYLTLKEHRDRGHPAERSTRWAVLGLLTAISVAGLLNAFGEHPHSSRAVGEAAELSVTAPTRLRGGLFYEGRFSVVAREDIDDAVLVLDPGWLEQTHINTIEPAPTEESGRDGRLALGFGPVEAGERLVVYLQFQVNPTNVGRRSQRVELRDGAELLASVDRPVTVFP
jgi:hypothetical protein